MQTRTYKFAGFGRQATLDGLVRASEEQWHALRRDGCVRRALDLELWENVSVEKAKRMTNSIKKEDATHRRKSRSGVNGLSRSMK